MGRIGLNGRLTSNRQQELVHGMLMGQILLVEVFLSHQELTVLLMKVFKLLHGRSDSRAGGLSHILNHRGGLFDFCRVLKRSGGVRLTGERSNTRAAVVRQSGLRLAWSLERSFGKNG